MAIPSPAAMRALGVGFVTVARALSCGRHGRGPQRCAAAHVRRIDPIFARETAVAAIFELFDRFGADHYGENVSQLQHALQCAGLAREHGCPDALSAASLLHDIGRMLDPAGNDAELRGEDARHEDLGAQALAPVFPPAVTEPIRLHVAAKRYLCAVDPAYAASLSAASILSLGVQGGAMSPDEVAAFEAEPFFGAAVQLRRFDDWGKRTGCELAPLEAYRPLLEAVMLRD